MKSAERKMESDEKKRLAALKWFRVKGKVNV